MRALDRLSLIACTLHLFASSNARADGPPSPYDAQAWALAGVNNGVAFRPGGPGYVLGGEASLVLGEPSKHEYLVWWYGLYGDGVYDFTAKRTRLTIGPEIGWGFFGVDGGALVEAGGSNPLFGFAVRPLLTVGVVSIYGRVGVLPAASSGPVFVETGALLKYPFELTQGTVWQRLGKDEGDARERTVHVERWWKVNDPERGPLLIAEIAIEDTDAIEAHGIGISMGGEVLRESPVVAKVRVPDHGPALVVVALPEIPVNGSAGISVFASHGPRGGSFFYFYEGVPIRSDGARPLGAMSNTPAPRY